MKKIARAGLDEIEDTQARTENDDVIEEEDLQAHKLEEIGRLATGIAHDINNVLAGIMGLSTLLREDTESDDPRMQDIEKLLSMARRGGELTRNLLTFARKGKSNSDRIYLNSLVVGVEQILKRTMPRKIVFETNLDSHLALIEGDTGQISQLLMNLCINATDAIEGRGTVTISTGNSLPPSEDPNSGRYVRLQVADNGQGMDNKTLEQIFEPFFTTKEPGKGTGLGLAMVHSIVESFGGVVSVESQVGKGTTFTVLLPAARSFVPEQVANEPAPRQMKNGSGTVLLVDDDEAIRESSKRLLNRLGYKVFLAEHGKEAIDLYKIYHETIDLVLLDLNMPIMDGTECFFKLQDVNAEAKVIILSGMMEEIESDELLTAGALGFLQKPFEWRQFGDAVASVITGSLAPCSPAE